MNLTRLLALGILAANGPSHGHHIRRVADVTNVGEWGGVSVGALYRELRAMEREGLVEAARTEKVGNRPERTVYAITPEGQLELTTLREQAIRPLVSGPDPLGVALLFAAHGIDRGELRRTLRARREMLAIGVAEVRAERARLAADGFLDVLASAVMRRGILGMEAEISWHDELDAALAEAALAESGSGEAGGGESGGGAVSDGSPGDAVEAARARRQALGIAGDQVREPAAREAPAERPDQGR